MPVRELPAFSQCSVDFHLDKVFVIGLRKPSQDRLNELRTRYNFATLDFDDDRDLFGRDGRVEGGPSAYTIRELGFLTSSERAAAVCLGQTTDGAIALLEEVAQLGFDVGPAAFRAAIDYVTYKTTTKAKFSGPLNGLMGATLRGVAEQWADLSSRKLAAPIDPAVWPPASSAMVHCSSGYWEKYFGKGAPDRAFVVPADLDFLIYLPSRFFKMTKYRFRLTVESFEDFLDNEYFAYSDLPYVAHMALLNQLDAAIVDGKS